VKISYNKVKDYFVIKWSTFSGTHKTDEMKPLNHTLKWQSDKQTKGFARSDKQTKEFARETKTAQRHVIFSFTHSFNVDLCSWSRPVKGYELKLFRLKYGYNFFVL